MNLDERFLREKSAVARFLVRLFGSSTDVAARLAARLETELADQIRYDHREVEHDRLVAAWKGQPEIGKLLAAAPAGPSLGQELSGLAEASYAFRLLVLAHAVADIEAGSGDAAGFRTILDSLGLGIQEVKAYRADFVRD